MRVADFEKPIRKSSNFAYGKLPNQYFFINTGEAVHNADRESFITLFPVGKSAVLSVVAGDRLACSLLKMVFCDL